MPKQTLKSLTLWDYSDRELLMIVRELEHHGWASTEDVATTLGIVGDRPRSNVGTRLSWLKRFGVVDKHPREKKLWRVNDDGEMFLDGKLAPGFERFIDGAAPGQMLLQIRRVARHWRDAEASTMDMVRREWHRGTKLGRDDV